LQARLIETTIPNNKYKNISVQDITRGHPIFQKYNETIKLFFTKQYVFQAPFYNILIKTLIKRLSQIIINSPSLEDDLYVYRGVDKDVITFDTNHLYKTDRFISTTLDPKYATKFMEKGCCLWKIRLLKGTKILYPVISNYDEKEFILPPSRYFYNLGKFSKVDNELTVATIHVNNVLVAN
jgi:hypothetical protein